MKIAAYIAGDENIIYPSIVALNSVKENNKNVDLYLFTSLNNLPPPMGRETQ